MELTPGFQSSNLGVAIIQGACNPEAKGLVTDLGDSALHSLLDDGVGKEIPVLKSIIACRKTWAAIHDQLFLQKVLSFLQACPKFTETERKKFLDKCLSAPKKTTQLSRAIVLILDKLDDLDKPKLLARAFAALVRDRIPLETFRRLAAAIDIGFVEDLLALQRTPRGKLDEPLLRSLLRTGFVEITQNTRRITRASQRRLWIVYRVSILGATFVECLEE